MATTMIDGSVRRLRRLDRRWRFKALALSLLVLGAVACERSHQAGGTGETHFLRECSEECGVYG
jgi:hypothetical protein